MSVAAAQAHESDVAAAANAFEQAQRAELKGELTRAAELYELADRIAPAPESLRSATRAWLASGQLPAAATLAEELLRRYAGDAPSRELAEHVLGRTRPELTRLEVSCSSSCTLSVDGLAAKFEAQREHVLYVQPGAHSMVARFRDGTTRARHVEAGAGEARSERFVVPEMVGVVPPNTTATAAAAVTEPRSTETSSLEQPLAGQATAAERHGLDPVYFWAGLVVSVGVGAVALWSGLDLLKARDDFRADATPTRTEFEAGEQKDLRTGVLLGATAVCAASTLALGLFSDFRGKRASAHTALAPHPQGAQLFVQGRF